MIIYIGGLFKKMRNRRLHFVTVARHRNVTSEGKIQMNSLRLEQNNTGTAVNSRSCVQNCTADRKAHIWETTSSRSLVLGRQKTFVKH